MNIDDYQKWTQTTAAYPSEQELLYVTLGLGNEAGELQGKVKKFLRGDYNNYMDDGSKFAEDVIAEAGDVLWYLARIATHFGVTIEQIAEYNRIKLESRKERGVIKGDGDNR